MNNQICEEFRKIYHSKRTLKELCIIEEIVVKLSNILQPDNPVGFTHNCGIGGYILGNRIYGKDELQNSKNLKLLTKYCGSK